MSFLTWSELGRQWRQATFPETSPIMLEVLEPRLLLSADLQEFGLAELGTVEQGINPFVSVPYKKEVALAHDEPALAPPSDPNDQIREAVFKGAVPPTRAHYGVISPSTDVDMFAFNVIAGQKIGIDIDRPSGSDLDSYLRLFRADGALLSLNNHAAGPDENDSVESYLEYTFATAGTYYVGVSGYNNNAYSALNGTNDKSDSSVGRYTLILTDLGVSSPRLADADSPKPSARTAGETQGPVGPAGDPEGLIDVLSEVEPFRGTAGLVPAVERDGRTDSYKVSPQAVSHIQNLWTIMSELRADPDNGYSGSAGLDIIDDLAQSRQETAPLGEDFLNGADVSFEDEPASADTVAASRGVDLLHDIVDRTSPVRLEVDDVLQGPLDEVGSA